MGNLYPSYYYSLANAQNSNTDLSNLRGVKDLDSLKNEILANGMTEYRNNLLTDDLLDPNGNEE